VDRRPKEPADGTTLGCHGKYTGTHKELFLDKQRADGADLWPDGDVESPSSLRPLR
jgi:hypothetical protein